MEGPLLQRTASFDREALATNGVQSSDQKSPGKKTLIIIGSIPKSKFWHIFDVLFSLNVFMFYNAIKSNTFFCKFSASWPLSNKKIWMLDKGHEPENLQKECVYCITTSLWGTPVNYAFYVVMCLIYIL